MRCNTVVPDPECEIKILDVKLLSIVHKTREHKHVGLKLKEQFYAVNPQGADPLHLPLRVAKAGRNHLNEEITPLLPTGIGERYSQTISNVGQAALLYRCDGSLPL
jgi:hypothetical protein